jgi:Ca2+-transporting ATPase
MRERFGKNEMSAKKPKSFIKRLIEALSEPTLLILEFAWAITLGVNIGKYLKSGSGDFLECLGIFIAVAF